MGNVFKILFFVPCLCIGLVGCVNVKDSISKVGQVKIPEFREDAEHIGDYPDVAKAPQRPNDIRSDAAWDKEAKKIINVRDGFSSPEDSKPNQVENEIVSKIKLLGDKVDEYKFDDPK